MNNKTQNNSNTPFAIIGIVLLVALVGGWWFYQSSKSPASKPKINNANKATPDDTTAKLYQNASPGAQPPNMLGSPNAPVTIEEFADYQCPTCAIMHPKMKEINGLFGNRVKFVYRSFPLTQMHKNAYDAAVAAEAAGLQGKFWAMQDQLFNNQQAWANSNEPRKIFDEYAQKIGLDVPKFQDDMQGIIAKSRVDADMQRGRSAGIDGTPTIYINGRKLAPNEMDVDVMRGIIESDLQRSNSQAQSGSSNQSIGAKPNSQIANAPASSAKQ